MDTWNCSYCDYVYNSENGDSTAEIAQDTLFEELPEDWECPVCGAGSEDFKPDDDDGVDEEAVQEKEEQDEHEED